MDNSKIFFITSVTIGGIIGMIYWFSHTKKDKDIENENEIVEMDEVFVDDKKKDDQEVNDKSTNNESDIKSINSYEEVLSIESSEHSFPVTPISSPTNKENFKKSKIPVFQSGPGQVNVDTIPYSIPSPSISPGKGSKLLEPKITRKNTN
uniref:Exported protein n=1 Tax=Strongyloides papillosus TaxID=174720 RepID=A0A0N5C5E3_STREA